MTTATTSRKATLTKPGDRELRVERIFDAPRDRVWRAMTEPELLAQWWGRGNKLVVERFELERGGHWRFVEHSDHGVHGFEGRYREVTPPEHLECTFEWDGMPGHVVIQDMRLVDLGDGRTKLVGDVHLLHDRRARRHARVGHGRRHERELRRARCPAGSNAVVCHPERSEGSAVRTADPSVASLRRMTEN